MVHDVVLALAFLAMIVTPALISLNSGDDKHETL